MLCVGRRYHHLFSSLLWAFNEKGLTKGCTVGVRVLIRVSCQTAGMTQVEFYLTSPHRTTRTTRYVYSRVCVGRTEYNLTDRPRWGRGSACIYVHPRLAQQSLRFVFEFFMELLI